MDVTLMLLIFSVLAGFLLVFVLPLWLLMHYATKWRNSQGLSKDDEKMLEDLWTSAVRMEERVRALEEILDADYAPRRKPDRRPEAH